MKKYFVTVLLSLFAAGCATVKYTPYEELVQKTPKQFSAFANFEMRSANERLAHERVLKATAPLPPQIYAGPTLTFAWNPNPSADGVIAYNFYTGAKSGSYTNQINVGAPTTTLSLGSWLINKTNYVAVDAVNSLGSSGYSAELAFVVVAPPATNVYYLTNTLLFKTNINQASWIPYTNFPALVISNPPYPNMFFQNRLSIMVTNMSQ